jgi:SAM-dependent methyltransferase
MGKPHLSLSKEYWLSHLAPDDFAIDATCGNGHDTLFLSQRLPQGTVFALDIQERALSNTKKLLSTVKNVQYFCQSHDQLDLLPIPRPPHLIVYNLGYLPGGDKSITTRVESTLKSIRQSLLLLHPNGALSITCYPGHDEGLREETEIFAFANTLAKTVSIHRWGRLRSPSLLWICK